jgi:hypothetical protein
VTVSQAEEVPSTSSRTHGTFFLVAVVFPSLRPLVSIQATARSLSIRGQLQHRIFSSIFARHWIRILCRWLLDLLFLSRVCLSRMFSPSLLFRRGSTWSPLSRLPHL